MPFNRLFRENEGRKVIKTDAGFKVISAAGTATVYTLEGNLIGRWTASENEISEYNDAAEYIDAPEYKPEDHTNKLTLKDMRDILSYLDVVKNVTDRNLEGSVKGGAMYNTFYRQAVHIRKLIAKLESVEL